MNPLQVAKNRQARLTAGANAPLYSTTTGKPALVKGKVAKFKSKDAHR